MPNQRSLPTMEQMLIDKAESPKRNPWGVHRPRNASPANNGEKCRTCIYAVQMSYSKTFYKCELAKKHWTHSTKTDIRLKDEACNFYEKE